MKRPALALAVYVALAAVVGTREGPVLCPFRRATGRACPACGLTRSIAATVRADLRGAHAHHRLGPVLVVGVATWCAILFRVAAGPNRASRRGPGPSPARTGA